MTYINIRFEKRKNLRLFSYGYRSSERKDSFQNKSKNQKILHGTN
jgi:hypothetical protein